MNCDFSLGVLAGSESRKRMVDTLKFGDEISMVFKLEVEFLRLARRIHTIKC